MQNGEIVQQSIRYNKNELYTEQKTKMLHALNSLGEHNYKNHTFIPFVTRVHASGFYTLCATTPVRCDYNFTWNLNHTYIIHHHHSQQSWERMKGSGGAGSRTAMETFSYHYLTQKKLNRSIHHNLQTDGIW